MLKMTWTNQNGKASLAPEKVREFISQTHLIGIGSHVTRGFIVFRNLRKGDIVLVLGKGWTPQVIVRVLDDEMEEYHPAEKKYPLLDDWIEYVRKIEILTWCYSHGSQFKLPPFHSRWALSTCCRIYDVDHRETITKWIENIMNNKTVEDYAELLRKAKNLVLTGAPGTGKTCLARQIANAITGDTDETPKDMRHSDFVQFHPSYDYTDFVEGLRPISPDENGNIGFQGRDGIFKAFCKRAFKSGNNGTDNFEVAWQSLVNSLNDVSSIRIPMIKKNASFEIELNEYDTGLASRSYTSELEYRNRSVVPGRTKYFSKNQLYRVYRGMPGVESGAHDNYRKAIINWMKLHEGLQDYNAPTEEKASSDKQKYVFIIDEINRGDIAKIFGELFYAIEPDCRGMRGAIKTQYANLFEDDEVFGNGMFFVPENVYIIGTMNDIDRNVECMDFAIRRRFTWVEVKPEDTVSMWDNAENGIPEYKNSAKTCMDAVNAKISETPGLGSAYQLGPAYFLKLKNYNGDFNPLWDNHIGPLLKEYLRGMPDAARTYEEIKEIWNKNTRPADDAATPGANQHETE